MIRIPVMHVVRRELEMPFEFAGIRVDRQERIGIEIVTFARLAI
jgi:hypothetical protein